MAESSREIVFGEIRRLGLQANVLELEEKGYTVVPDALSMATVERMRDVILRQTQEKSGLDQRPDLETWDGGNLRDK